MRQIKNIFYKTAITGILATSSILTACNEKPKNNEIRKAQQPSSIESVSQAEFPQTSQISFVEPQFHQIEEPRIVTYPQETTQQIPSTTPVYVIDRTNDFTDLGKKIETFYNSLPEIPSDLAVAKVVKENGRTYIRGINQVHFERGFVNSRESFERVTSQIGNIFYPDQDLSNRFEEQANYLGMPEIINLEGSFTFGETTPFDKYTVLALKLEEHREAGLKAIRFTENGELMIIGSLEEILKIKNAVIEK